MGLFEKGFNKFADMGNALNKGVNKIVGKEIAGEIKKMEPPKEFPPYSSYVKYGNPEPKQWERLKGSSKEFKLENNVITISENLDTCMQYADLFKEAARYYTDRFIFMYKQCVTDYDAFLNYFQDMYLEGLNSMLDRGYSLFLLFDVFNVSKERLKEYQLNTYCVAVQSYNTMLGIVEAKNQQANALGNAVGNSIQMRGGGFGFKGAMKGMAQAEAFNLGMNLVGKYVANQSKISAEEKAEIFSKFNESMFFEEVYSDYCNTFFSVIQILADNNVFGNISTIANDELNTMISNLQNPMFPQEKVAVILAKLISSFPFEKRCYDILKQKFGETEEVCQIIDYFMFNIKS